MSGAPEYPGCDVPSKKTGTVMLGSGDKSEIVWAPVPMLKSIVFDPGVAFESRIACRSEPAPESLVSVTVKVEGIIRRSRPWKSGWNCRRFFFLSNASRRRLIVRRLPSDLSSLRLASGVGIGRLPQSSQSRRGRSRRPA